MLNIPSSLSPVDTDSFAYITFKDRLPVIITRVVDYVYRNKKVILNVHGNDKIESIKYITSELSRLRHELTTNKVISDFDGSSVGDEDLWNNAIANERKRLIECGLSSDDEIHWFKTSFLFGENYMYRRIYDIVVKSGLPKFDPFCFEKEELLERSLGPIQLLTTFLNRVLPQLSLCDENQLMDYFEIFLKMSLWGNEADLSLSVSEEECKLKKKEPRIIVEENESKLLVDEHKIVFKYLYERLTKNQSTTVTIILDNSGSELLVDLHLAEFLLSSKLASKVVLMAKSLPWYVSDVTKTDMEHTLKVLSQSDQQSYRILADKISVSLASQALSIENHAFFTLPHPYCRMATTSPLLYTQLSSCSLLIFKGDLNYRKLVSDLNWPHVATTFQESLLGFCPAPLVSLRVLKCDVQVGLSSSAYERAMAEFPNDWMIKARYGVVQTAGFSSVLC